jgi:hypothetical protein
MVPVAGLYTAKVLPDAASTSLPSISRRLRWPTNFLAGGLSRLSSAMVSMFPPRWLMRYSHSEIAAGDVVVGAGAGVVAYPNIVGDLIKSTTTPRSS